MYKLLDGRIVAEKIKEKIKSQVEELRKKNIVPTLAVILVGNDPASQLYVNIKEKTAEELNIATYNYQLSTKTTEEELIKKIRELNNNKKIQAILVQLPLPKHINTNKIIAAISPQKDVDVLTPENVGKLLLEEKTIVPPTAAAILEILAHYKIDITGKHIVLVGYGKLVGKPLAAMISLSNEQATLTVCNKQTKNLSYYTRQADILISATGCANLIKSNMVKRGVIIIDAGTSRIMNYELGITKIVGDVEFDRVKNKARFITPQKGGVGPVTVAMLLANVIKLIK